MSPITPKTNLTTPMLPLHAIPTEVIRKGFRPYRGFMTTVAINIPDEDAPLALLVDAPQGPLTGEKVALLALNVFPIYEVFAQLFGYDPKLLMVGNGDCGVEGHDWNLYGVKDRVPQVVRWRGFDGGEALFCIGTHTGGCREAEIVGVSNAIMAPKMAQAFATIGELCSQKHPQAVDVPMGNLLQKVEVESRRSRHDFSACLWPIAKEEAPSAELMDELTKLRFSCKVDANAPSGMHRYKVRRDHREQLNRQLRDGQRYVIAQKECHAPLVFQPGEPIPQTIIDQIYGSSVRDAEKEMQALLRSSFERQEERVHGFLHEEELAVTIGDPEENERAYALSHFIHQAEQGRMMRYNHALLEVNFSRAFASTPARTLLGTHSVKRLSDGDVRGSADLIEMLIHMVCDTADRKLVGRRPDFELLGRIIASDDLALKRDQMTAHSRGYPLEKPYTALYRGLPIRVTDSHVVIHGDGSESLACDYYLDQQNQALHFVSLYRVKAPKVD